MDADECFYHRVDPAFVQPDNSVDPLHIKVFNLSSNRGKFSESWYVLYPRKDFGSWAVFKFILQDLPKTVKGQARDAKEHEIRTEHDPEEDNYGHCETRIYKDGERLEKENKLKDGPKNALRIAFSLALKFGRAPGDPFPPPGWQDPGC